jgi:hypothetical protein
MWGTKYDYDYRQARLYDRAERQSLISTNSAFRLDIDYTNRVVTGFSNILGKLVITWGEFSEDFQKVPFYRLNEVIDLAKAYTLRHLGMIRSQQTSNLPNQFNPQVFLDRAKELQDKIIGKWQKFTKITIIKT